MRTSVLALWTCARKVRPHELRRWRGWLSVSLGVWWCALALSPVGAQVPSGAVPSVSSRSQGFILNGSSTNDFSGKSVSGAGDVNGDGLDDVIVGADSASPDGLNIAGRSYVVFGKRNNRPVELADIESGTSPRGFVINGSTANDNSGRSVSGAGDVNGDGLDDVIVGASGADPAGRYDAGRSYVVFGKRNTQPVELADIESGTSPHGFVINGSTANDNSGESVSGAGDVNGDGLDDVIVGAVNAFDGVTDSLRSGLQEHHSPLTLAISLPPFLTHVHQLLYQ
ncbi:FG-GAP-like repeat-containing protein [Gloeobacter morelensis]|uniref:VCBS repeat-containing protein n=1 Tax=Gloeobacter morelensis MG652769 TaxID=2781736 RepID=A0ABY3PPQ4_9CYAN|nr:FG-GAP-like repeat-containing protein [Gloeobacter morelensis]UFP95687.1 VCBS repeat-containing protein [Gloeobacter morelensis MG652769]